MISNLSGVVRIAPLLILRFPLLAPKKLYDAQKFNLTFTASCEMTETADKLRWYRYKKALLQRDVADFAGIDRSTYTSYEEYGRDYYPIEHMVKIAVPLEVTVDELLDEYNTFLYHGQGEQIQALRLKPGPTQEEFADSLGASLWKFKKWGQERVQISKATWERYFKNAVKEKTE